MTKTNTTTSVPQHAAIAKKQESIDVDTLRQFLDYNPLTGIFTWKVKRNQYSPVGGVAGNKRPDGYVAITVKRRDYLAHRLAVLFETGQWPAPTMDVDHINGNPGDNRIENLRVVSRGENLRNRGGSDRDSSTGIRGVTKNRKGWIVHHQVGGKHLYFGTWPTIKEAEIASYQVMVHYGILGERMKAPEGLPSGLPTPPGRRMYCCNTSGYRGVSFKKSLEKWMAYTEHNGRRVHLGYFATAELASEAKIAADRLIASGQPPK